MTRLFLSTVSAMALFGSVAFVLVSATETDAYASTTVTGASLMAAMTAPADQAN